MRKKRLIAIIAVMLIVVFALSMALVACKKNTVPDETPSGEPPITSGSVPSGDDPIDSGTPIVPPSPSEPEPEEKPVIPNYATNFRGAVGYMVEAMPSEYLSLNFKGTATVRGKRYVMTLKGNLFDNDIQVSAVFKPEGSDKSVFALYIIDSRLFIELEDGAIFNVAEIDVNYLASIIDKVPDKLSGIIDDALEDEIAAMIPDALDILLNGFAPTIKYEESDGVEKFDIAIDVQGLTDMISAIGGLLGIAGINLDLTFVTELLDMIPLINGVISATVDNKILTEFKVELYDNDPQSENYKQTLFGIENAITFSTTPLQLDVPDEIVNYETLTLGNLNADFTLDIDTHGEAFDIGALIDEFLPTAMFGEGILVLKGDSDYKLDIKLSLDPDLYVSEVDNNYINIVLCAGENELIRANYLDGKIYVKALANGINGFADGGINMAIPFDLKGYVAQLVKLVTDAIDGFLGTQFRPQDAAAFGVLTASINESGEVILTPSIQNVITSILKLVGFEDCIEMTGDKIIVAVDKTLFDKISEIAKIDPIDLPIFGEVVIGLFNGGIEYLEVTAMDILTLRADNFLLGKSKISREYVAESIGDTEAYGEDIESILLSFGLSLLSDLELSLALDMSTVNTTVNLTSIINGIMAVANSSTYLKFPIALDLSKYDGTFNLRIATNYDSETGDGRMLLELITPEGDTLISAYNENSDTYVDLSGLGFMKFCLTNVNLFRIIRGMLGADMPIDDFVEEVAPVMSMSSYTSGVEIDSNYIDVAVNSYFITLVTRMLAMDLGLDLDLKAHLNFDGSVNMNLGLGNAAALGLTMSLGKESKTEHRIADVINGLPKGEYGEYNAIDAEMLVDSILVAERLNLTIDLYEQNIDNTSHENKTRIVIRNAKVAAEGGVERLDNGMEAPYKSIVAIIYSTWNNTSNAIAYAVIDLDGGKIQIKLAEGALTGIKLGSSSFGISLDGVVPTIIKAVDIPINVDLKTTLINALSGLFGDADKGGDNFGGIIDVPDDALPAHKPHKCSQVCEICGKCLDADCKQEGCTEKCDAVDGVHPTPEEPKESAPAPEIDQILRNIVVSLTGSMDVDVDVNINGLYISKMLKELLQDVFTDLDLSSMGISGLINIDYINDTENGKFAENVYSKILLPLIEAQASGMVKTALSFTNAKDIIVNLINRFLPLPNIHDLAVNVSLTDGKLANITAIGSNTCLGAKKDKVEVTVDGLKYRSDLGFGIYIFNRKADEVISWEDQATDIYFNPTLGGNLMDMFVPQARKHVETNWESDSWANVNWTLKDVGTDLATFSQNIATQPDGEYIFVGTAWGDTIEVKVTLHNSKVVTIKDMQVKAMRDVPTYVPAVFADGTERLITDVEIALVDGRKNVEKLIDPETKEPIIDEETGNAIDYNASVTLGGEVYKFKIFFEDEDISLDTLVLNAYDYIDKINSLKTSGVVRVKINDTFYRNLPATYDFTMFTDEFVLDENGEKVPNDNYKTRQDLQRPATYQVDVHVGAGTVYERDMVLDVEFTPFTIYYIEVGGLNYIQTDFIEYSKGESFPEEITVVGYNGKEELRYVAKAEWNTDTVTVDLKGGQYFASAILNKGEFNEWRMEGIEVEVLSTDIVDLSNSNKSVTFDWKYYFYGNVPLARCYPTLLNFKTSNGIIKRDVPVTIDLTSIFADAATLGKAMAEGMTFECPISIDIQKQNSKESLFKTTIEVVVPSIKMSLENSVIDIDYNDYVTYGKSAFFKDNMEIMLGEDKVSANVTWFTDEVIFNTNGEYTAIVYIDRDGQYEQSCEVTVNITNAPAVEEV